MRSRDAAAIAAPTAEHHKRLAHAPTQGRVDHQCGGGRDVPDRHHLCHSTRCAASVECDATRGTGNDSVSNAANITARSVTDAGRDESGKGNSDDQRHRAEASDGKAAGTKASADAAKLGPGPRATKRAAAAYGAAPHSAAACSGGSAAD
jgi:hypothetical protein